MELEEFITWKGRKLVEPNDEWLTAERMVLANIPRKRWDTVWKYYPDETPFKKELLQYVNDLDGRRVDGGGLLLLGETGEGKTSAAVLVMKEVIRRNGFPYYVPARDLQDIFLGKLGEEVLRKIRLCVFLVIDDIGDGRCRRYATDMFEGLIRDRDDKMLPTILTSNLSVPDLTEAYGDPCMRVIGDTCRAISFD